MSQRDPRSFIENPESGLKIVGFDGLTHPLKFTWSQNQIHEEIERQRREDKPVRLVILKARQVGISSSIAADAYTQAFNRNNFYGLVMAHKKEVTESLFRTKYKFYHENLPPDLQIPLKRSNKSELLFGPTNSVLQVVTATSNTAVRSRTLWYLHASECGFYDDLDTLKTGVEPSVPRLPGTTIIWESTANGVGGDFHDLYFAAKAGENGYVAKFLEWFKDPDLVLRPWQTEKEMDAYMSFVYEKRPDLKDRADQYRLRPEQVAFYYDRLIGWYGGDERKMCQEYPCDDSEAFLASGDPVFSTKYTSEFANLCREGERFDPTISFSSFDNLRPAQNLVPNKDTYLEVWERPRPDRYYVISVDPSAGHETSDYQSAYVFDMFTQNIVAHLHGRRDPKFFTEEMLIPLGKMYSGKNSSGGALIAVERDGIGEIVISYLKDVYFNLYIWRKEAGFGVKFTSTIGFEMSKSMRPALVVEGRQLMEARRADPNLIPDKMLVSEIRTFVHAKDGRPEASSGCHDDRVMSWLIGIKVCIQELYMNPDLRAEYDRQLKRLDDQVAKIKQLSYEELLRQHRDPRYGISSELPSDDSEFPDAPFSNTVEDFEL